MNPDEIERTVRNREKFLEDLIRGKVLAPIVDNSEVKFIIARRWNSWYPSYFKTLGGCYVIQTRDNEHIKGNIDENAGTIVIDPGFGFMNELWEKYNIEPHDIRKIIVTHFHPDHMAGLIEFLTLTNESKHPCDIYLNRTSYNFFKTFQGKYNKIIQLNGGQHVNLSKYKYEKGTLSYNENIKMKAIKVHHSEIGNVHQSLGLIFDIDVEGTSWKIGILGDTDGSDCYLDEYINNFRGVDILVLHLGTFSDKHYGEGDKHLYKTGLFKLIDKIISDAEFNKGLKLLILSEFGLEMADYAEIADLMQGFLGSVGSTVNILFMKYFNSDKDLIFPKTLIANRILEIFDFYIKNDFATLYLGELYYSNLFSIISFNPKGFLDNKSNIKKTLKLTKIAKSHIKRYSDLIDWGDPYVSSLSNMMNEYIKQIFEYSFDENDKILNELKAYSEKCFKEIRDKYIKNKSYKFDVDFVKLDSMKKLIASLMVIDDAIIEIAFKADFETVIYFNLIFYLLLYKKITQMVDYLKKFKVEKLDEPEIIKSMLEIFYDMENDGTCKKTILAHEGIEIILSKDLEIKSIVENTKPIPKCDWVPLNNVAQIFEDGKAKLISRDLIS